MRDELGVGATLGSYRIDGLVGRGGMGVVYRATHVALERTVALKVLAPELASSYEFRKRFEREARIAASIDDPNVVALYEAGDVDGRLFLAMQYIQGRDFQRVISEARGGSPPERVADIVSQVGNALEAAHSRGLVHRDVKPANILIADMRGRDHAYLTDFGLTREASSDSGFTRTGQFVGTIDYVSPEQITGGVVDARTDVYALGCVLFAALTGRVPYARDSTIASMYAHINEAPPAPSDLVPGLARDFDAIVELTLAKNPAERIASAGLVGAAALAAARGDHARVVEILGPTRRRRDGHPRAATGPASILPAPGPPPAGAPGVAPSPPTAVPYGGARTRSVPGRARRHLLRARRRLESPRSSATHVQSVESRTVRIPLDPSFAYLHGPLGEDAAIPLLGNHDVIEALQDRLAHSPGGCFLLTGFRGAGKTTVVDRALSGLEPAAGDRVVLRVRVDLPAPKSPDELLFELVRGLYDCVADQRSQGRLGELDPEVDDRLVRAYRQTRAQVSESREQTLDRTGGASIGVPLGAVTAKAERGVRSSVHSRDDQVFGAYTAPAAESDFKWLAAHMYGNGVGAVTPKSGRWRLWRGSQPAEPTRVRGQVVVVLDEIDKLTELPNGDRAIRSLVIGLKTLFTARDVHFLFVAGADLFEAVANERGRGNSVFGSVFDWQEYVPCIWGVEERLLDAVISDPVARGGKEVELLRGHLAFWGRGLPRDTVQELNAFVKLEGGRHYLVLSQDDIERISRSSVLEECVLDFVESHEEADTRELEIDKWRRGVYYAVESILRFETPFRLGHVMKLGGEQIDKLFALTREEVRDLLHHLVDSGLLRAGEPSAADPVLDGVPDGELVEYEVIPGEENAVLSRAHGLLAADEYFADAADDAVLVGYLGQTLGHGRYTLLEELDRSGLGRVYRARDRDSGDEVAVKVFEGLVRPGDTDMRERFQREGRIALGLRHPHIVSTRTTFSEPDGRLAIVMDLVPGLSIGRSLSDHGTWSPSDAVAVGSRVLDALGYLADRGVARLDLRPSSIMVDDSLSPVVVNLALAKDVGMGDETGPTLAGAVLGTPRYAAPEQLSGDAVDVRADMYSLALILIEVLVGEPVRSGDSVSAVLRAAHHEAIDVRHVPGSPALRSVLARALDPRVASRYESPSEMRMELLQTPEASEMQTVIRRLGR